MIIGLTGKNGAGKGVVADFLKATGFTYYSLSDIIRERLKQRGEEISRENLITLGRKLRAEGGPSVLADLILAKLDIDKNYVVDSIRNPAEVRSLRQRKNFIFINVEADQKVRFNRVKERARENDPRDFKEFVRLENEELQSNDTSGQQLLKTAAMADETLVNDGTVEQLREDVRTLVIKRMQQMGRPGWDEYFMNIARVASLRSNCLKRKVAAVIVREKRIVSTGYNGTPRGVKNCSEGGCPRCYSFNASGADLGECLCSHAEENAIVQSAYHGVSVRDATLYTTFSPCLMCTKMIINCGIREVVYNAAYPMSEVPLKLLKEAYVQVRQIAAE